MTDNEIINSLNVCANGIGCNGCAFVDNECCNVSLMQEALDLINRQKAENEKLTEDYNNLIYEKDLLFDEAKAQIKAKRAEIKYLRKLLVEKCDKCDVTETKVEAIKEFAERLKEKMTFETSYLLGIPYYRITERGLNDLLKEMVGDTE